MLQIIQISLVNPFYWLKGRVEGQVKYTVCSWATPTKALISLHSNLRRKAFQTQDRDLAAAHTRAVPQCFASRSQAFNLFQHQIYSNHHQSTYLKQSGMKGKWLQFAPLIELPWPFCNKGLLRKDQWGNLKRFPFLPLGGPKGPVHTASSGQRCRKGSHSTHTCK